jgi:hypothetical protein
MAEFGEKVPAATVVETLRDNPLWFLLEHLEASQKWGGGFEPIPGTFDGEKFSVPVGLALCEIALHVLGILPKNADTQKAIEDLRTARKFWRGELPRDTVVDTLVKLKYTPPWVDEGRNWRLSYAGPRIRHMVDTATQVARVAMFFCFYSSRRYSSSSGAAHNAMEVICESLAIHQGLSYKFYEHEEDRDWERNWAVGRREIIEIILDTFKKCLDEGFVVQYFLTEIIEWSK